MMNVQAALKSQYRASLAMLRQTIERCPDDLWTAGEHPRTYWRIAYHGLFFAQLYLGQNEKAFRPWERHRDEAEALGPLPWPPHDMPKVIEPYSQRDLMDYADFIVAKVDETVDGLDLDSQESGFGWYSMPKLDHEILNIRHIQQHAGQLAELLYAVGVDLDWIG